ncbi:gas vesicle protein [Leptolyngbya sp. 'hensonii']|uniref:gas vesicle protein n=1 Tax=Leptolyngbya sp. 'hensonii' TaxID=1922337 RepID=UPI0009FA6201|nr:gas vesicle protein [Leptolyngbya sp. 'hensonii']
MTTGPQARSSTPGNRAIATSTTGSSLADVLERVLDKGIVIAGDISITVGSTELLSIRIRLLISSVDKAREIGINWWENDPYLNTRAQALLNHGSANEIQQLQERIQSLEAELKSLRNALPEEASAAPLPVSEARQPDLQAGSAGQDFPRSDPDQSLTLDALMDEL